MEYGLVKIKIVEKLSRFNVEAFMILASRILNFEFLHKMIRQYFTNPSFKVSGRYA
jgi:hypothetical protein